MSKVKIGLTDGRAYELYAQWITSLSDDIELIQLGYRLNNINDLDFCDGLIFSGGEDVHPQRYKSPEYLSYCEEEDFDLERDEFEWQLLHKLAVKPIPILGICRGMQLLNVYHGGTLIPDLTSWGKFNHSKGKDGLPTTHQVHIDEQSYLRSVLGQSTGYTNSLHHQSLDRVGKGLVVTAISPDGVVEALENKEIQPSNYLLAVQWHPERMNDRESPFVKNIGLDFIKQVLLFTQSNQNDENNKSSHRTIH
ncbi:gamma-glutamyl-gamma-aminobutyrate hydrolase family protein [Sphingobacterium chungjuense]|uniref:gamma-glutamyl-gamma-aminobutyrate hydrolase family protein n=1 Tax=Sphingobacterium chungjuense TaxID=2675553 RepID=UPI0019D1FA5C|nr:gamma-glutamyl-gamma-aminobutyrate hydrolase family protein [Sphingobacterium chungjuense]